MVYGVIDTNVLVSAIFAAHPDSATVIVRDKIMDGTIVPLYNAEIFDEYRDVLTRPKFHFPAELVDAILDVILQKGLSLERTKTEEVFTDPISGHGKHEAFPSYPHCGHACRIAQDS